MRTRLRKFVRLPAAEQILLCRAAVRLAWTTVAVRTCSAQRLVSHLSKRPPAISRTNVPAAEKIAWAVEACAPFIPSAACLSKSLALCSLLHAYGYSACVRIGVRNNDGAFQAHAWVECGGIALPGAGDSDFESLPIFPA